MEETNNENFVVVVFKQMNFLLVIGLEENINYSTNEAYTTTSPTILGYPLLWLCEGSAGELKMKNWSSDVFYIYN